MILLRALLVPLRVFAGTTRVAFTAGYRTGRLVGYRRLGLVVVGVGVGLLAAPVPGRDLRSAMRRRLEGRRVGSDRELAERVRFELSHHPRTWHLAQPQVDVVDRRVSLRGSVPDAVARGELVAAAASLPGVASVDDRLEVTGTAKPV